MRNILAIFLASAITLVLTGCNTVSGFGKDMKQGGKAIEKTADKHKE